MPCFFVHRYDVVRVKVAVEAPDQREALKAADAYLAHHHPIPATRSHSLDPSEDDGQTADRLGWPTWLHYEEPGQEVVGYLVDTVGDETYESSLTFTPGHNETLEPGQSHALFALDDWRTEVANGDTQLGYESWLDGKIEADASSAESAP